MKNLLIAFLLIAASVANGAAQLSQVPTASSEYELNRYLGPVGHKYSVGTLVRQAHNTAVGVYDFARTGGATGDHAVGIDLPDNAIVRTVLFDTVTVPVSAGAGTLAFKVQSAGDLKAAATATDYADQMDGIPVNTAATAIKLTAARSVYAVIASSALTAGKIKVYVDYALSE